jgi:hypothetical protein
MIPSEDALAPRRTPGPFRPTVDRNDSPLVYAAELLQHRADVFVAAARLGDQTWIDARLRKLRTSWLIVRDLASDPDAELDEARRALARQKRINGWHRAHVRFVRRVTGFNAPYIPGEPDPQIEEARHA